MLCREVASDTGLLASVSLTGYMTKINGIYATTMADHALLLDLWVSQAHNARKQFYRCHSPPRPPPIPLPPGGARLK